MFWSSVPCIRSLKSAGQFIVNFVMGLMVGDRRIPGATVLGSRPSTSSANHRFSVPLACPVHRDGSFFLCIVTGSFVFWDFGSLFRTSLGLAVAAAAMRLEFDVAASLWPAVAAAAISTKDVAASWPPAVAHSE